MTLPAGTQINLPDDRTAALFRASFVNETEDGIPLTHPPTFSLSVPLRILTPAYLAERDAAELELHKTIQRLRAGVKTP